MKPTIQTGSHDKFAATFPIVARNVSGELIPPYAIMQVANASAFGTDLALNVIKPTGTTTAKYIFNGPSSIQPGGYGDATEHSPADCIYLGSAPTAACGPVAGAWHISANGKGFLSLGGAANGVIRVAAKDGVAAGDDFPLVRIQNNSGLDKPTGTLSGLTVPITTPPNAPRVPTFAWAAPVAEKPFAVLLNDIPGGGVGDAGPVGVVAVWLAFTDAAHTKADCETGNFLNLVSGTVGSATILWREKQHISGPLSLGLQWAMVLLDRDAEAEAIRGIVYDTVTAATDTPTGKRTPGSGGVKFSKEPTGAIGTPWDNGDESVQVENWGPSEYKTDSPVLLRLSRTDNTGNKVYEVIGGGSGVITGYTAHITGTISGGQAGQLTPGTGVTIYSIAPNAVATPLTGTKTLWNPFPVSVDGHVTCSKLDDNNFMILGVERKHTTATMNVVTAVGCVNGRVTGTVTPLTYINQPTP